MLLVELDNGFKIIAFWAMNDKKDLMQRYIGQVWMGLNKCLREMDIAQQISSALLQSSWFKAA
jgi:hypothetical protein